MARFALAFLVVLSACGNAVVSTAAVPDDDGNGNPNALLPGAISDDAGAPGSPDAGPATATLTGQVFLPDGQGANGAAVALTPTNLSTTVQGSDYLFEAVPLGPFTLTVTLSGYQTAKLTGILTDQGLSETAITLEASRALFAPDGGFSATWMAFAPDGGPLYAADEGSLWSVATDGGGATPLTTSSPLVKPLGFAPDGTPIYFTNYVAATDGGGSGSGLLELGVGSGLPLDFLAPGPYLIGDGVFFAPPSGAAPPYQSWSVVSAAVPVATVVIPQAFASPAPQATAFALVGYAPIAAWGNSCAEAFTATGSGAPTFLLPICAPTWSLPTAIGVSPDGSLAALEFSESAAYSTLQSDTWQVQVNSATTGGSLSQHSSATQFSELTAIVPLSDSSAAELYANGSLVLDGERGSSSLQATEVAALPDGSAMYLDGANLVHGTSKPLPFNASWSQPVVSPDAAHVVFPGVPMVIEVATWTSTALAETPQTAQFSADGSELLVVDPDGAIHVLTFPATGLADVTLEGTATLALLTPDGQAVVYSGTDPLRRSGVFEQPAIPPSASPQDAGTGQADGGTP